MDARVTPELLPATKLLALVVVSFAAAFLAGCDTDAYCFINCGGGSGTTSSGSGTGGAGGECGLFGCEGGGGAGQTGGGGSGPCEPNGAEVCDGADNDCNGKIDDVPGLDFTQPKSCGNCSTNCFTLAINCDPASIGCDPGPNPGTAAGSCTCALCATDYYDLDKDGACEYFCQKSADDDSLCNNKDDDCDGPKDEDVDLCTDPANCGKCGRACAIVHGTGACVQQGAGACTEANTSCEIANCDCNGPNDCWYDLDGLESTGCEYQCAITNGGMEICDGLDNDCDGKIDAADDSLAGVGADCNGDPDGICGEAAHEGKIGCVAGQLVCTGMNVLKENDVLETCNGADDDCDGVVDDNPVDAGNLCGTSSVFPCKLGTETCVAGAIVCVGKVDPGVEACNGVDDDCDGTIDAAAGMPPSDSVGACNVPPAAPMGATQPCQAGAKACVGGVVVCQGSVGPTSTLDGCGDDSNCDGALTNQPNVMTDVQNCGMCGNSCYQAAVHAIMTCNMGTCQFQGCENGYYDLDGNGTCEYACVFVSAQEACNGIDDNCNGTTDEGVMAPNPTQVCGVSPSAVTPECTSNVAVACVNGAWQCTFPANVCLGGCSANDEVCDTLDNDCDGLINENVPNYGQPCASDDGLAPPGHGACKTLGTYVCNGANATTCSAMKADCAGLPGGCTEACDGVDNDCDGLVDETFNAKGSAAATFVKPSVTKIGTNLWMYQYEASRPSSTSSSAGTGNGFWTTAPTGVTLDKTPACSVPTKIPWFNVTPQEAEQTCTQMGGALCQRTQWQTACTPNAACLYGYNPRGGAGSACATVSVPVTKFCNLAPTFDFNTMLAGDQDGLLPTASSSLANCWADWSGLQGNSVAANKLYDLTGNLREITKDGANYRLMGGAFNSQSEVGSACNFTFYAVDFDFKFFDTGFRCCFTSDPTL